MNRNSTADLLTKDVDENSAKIAETQQSWQPSLIGTEPSLLDELGTLLIALLPECQFQQRCAFDLALPEGPQ